MARVDFRAFWDFGHFFGAFLGVFAVFAHTHVGENQNLKTDLDSEVWFLRYDHLLRRGPNLSPLRGQARKHPNRLIELAWPEGPGRL